MSSPLLSVIVPVYNAAPWLARCLDSICAQTYRNLEILCVNDGSPDNSAEILAEYAAKDSRIKVFTQENAGLSAARNTALEHATGEWVTGVDSDDYLAPGVYERAVACLGDGVDMVFFGVRYVDEEGRELPANPYFELPAAGVYEMTPELAGQLNACFWSKLWRRSLIEENKLRFPHGLVHEDEALFFLSAPYTRKVAICPEPGYCYVQRQGSIMNADGLDELRRAERYLPVFEYVCAEYEKRHLLKGLLRAYLVMMYVRLSPLFVWLGAEGQGVRETFALIIRRCGLQRDSYLLERLLPVCGWKRFFLSRYPQSKVYRFFGVAVWCVCYSETGRVTDSRCMLFDRLMKLFG